MITQRRDKSIDVVCCDNLNSADNVVAAWQIIESTAYDVRSYHSSSETLAVAENRIDEIFSWKP